MSASVREKKGLRLAPRGLRGAKSYTATEQSSSRPAELTVRADWVADPQTGEQQRYAQAEALQVHGIPARYVEGYYLSSAAVAKGENGTVSLSGQDAHAWVEVYFDGIGWLPGDVTPGYYYDAVTLRQMVAMPDTVKKTAALDDSSSGACLGWNVPATDEEIARRIPEVEAGEYIRAADLMEKFVYGGVEPELYELRVLQAFLEKVYTPRRPRRGHRHAASPAAEAL
mgnify:FL=1